MYYSYISIDRNPVTKKMEVVYYDIPDDREERDEYVPTSRAFFHYPTEWGVHKAFKILRKHQIKIGKERIKHAKSVQQELKGLTLDF